MTRGKRQRQAAAPASGRTGRPGPGPRLSGRAQAMELATERDAKVAVLHQARGWWGAPLYHCPLCDRDFHRDLEAAEHLVHFQHPVLRWDARGCWR